MHESNRVVLQSTKYLSWSYVEYRCGADRFVASVSGERVGLIDDVGPGGGAFTVWPRSHRRLFHTFEQQYSGGSITHNDSRGVAEKPYFSQVATSSIRLSNPAGITFCSLYAFWSQCVTAVHLSDCVVSL